MAHHYTTPALILDRHLHGEHHTRITFYTEEFGLVTVFARSTRSAHSKLRSMLQKSFLGSVTMIRGKRSWKVVGALEETNVFYALNHERNKQQLMARMYWLVLRLVKGQEKNESLYRVLESFSRYLLRAHIDVEQLPALERLTALRILETLGYASAHPDLAHLLEEAVISPEHLGSMQAMQKLATKEINKALHSTHL